LNSFGGKLIVETVDAIRKLNEHPDTVFTVLTGEGRFFSAGADVRGVAGAANATFDTTGEKKINFLNMFTSGLEIVRSIVEHQKVFILALNGPGVGAGGAWFQGIADLVLSSDDAYLQIPFSALGLVPENGSAVAFAQHMGVHRANEFFMFGKKLTAQELENYGLINKIFPKQGFHASVKKYLQEQLDVNDGKSMMEAKRLQNAPLRDARMLAAYNAFDALAERFVADAPAKRFLAKRLELEARSKARAKI
jgi:peroxisomal 3,2-trans-enoyl-CoA isomerase